MRLYIPIDVSFAVQVLHALDDLVPEHQGGLERKPAPTEVEEVLERRPQKLLDDDVLHLEGEVLDNLADPD